MTRLTSSNAATVARDDRHLRDGNVLLLLIERFLGQLQAYVFRNASDGACGDVLFQHTADGHTRPLERTDLRSEKCTALDNSGVMFRLSNPIAIR